MKTSIKQTSNFRPTISKIVMALAVASVMGGMSITPALADNDHRQVRRDNGRHNGEWRGNRHHRRGYEQTYYYSQPYYSQPYYPQPYYAQPVYVPPPVYYAPQPSPGISLFFPLHIRR
jgi:hypothetical protein